MTLDPASRAKPMHTLRIRPAVEAALRDPARRLSTELQTLHDAQTATFRLGVMRSWLIILAGLEAASLWADTLSGPATFHFGVVMRLGVNLPLAVAVFFALPHVSERGRAFLFGAYNVALITIICIHGHYAQPAYANQYTMAAGMLITCCNLTVPVTLRRAAIFTGVATLVYVGLSLAPIGPNPGHALDLVILLALIGLASLRGRYTLQHSTRDAFLLRLQDAMTTQDVIFANRILLDLSNTDPLTHVANRRCFDDRLNAWWKRDARLYVPLGLLMVDVDYFKSYNDRYGHPAGDACLRTVAEAMSRELRHGQDTLARYGGEEFAVLLPGLAAAEVHAIGERLCRAVESLELPHEGRPDGVGHITVSVGAASSADPGVSPEMLIRAADSALYRSKRLGRNRLCSAEGLSDSGGAPEGLLPHASGVATLTHSAGLADELRSAMLGDHLHLLYQPIYDTRTSEVVAFEALLRWVHPLHGNIAPDAFIPVAEESGMIVAVGKWVLRKACAEAAAWTAPRILAANISPVQFSDPGIVATIAAILDESGLPPHRLLLEITEGLQLIPSKEVREALDGLRALGIGLALDDFGTGYANLNRLRELRFDVIKLDRSFFEPASGSVHPVDVLTPLVAFARAYGPKIVMEGVETAEQLAMVQALGCDWVQGFYLSKPLPSEAVHASMDATRRPMAGKALLST